MNVAKNLLSLSLSPPPLPSLPHPLFVERMVVGVLDVLITLSTLSMFSNAWHAHSTRTKPHVIVSVAGDKATPGQGRGRLM